MHDMKYTYNNPTRRSQQRLSECQDQKSKSKSRIKCSRVTKTC